MNDVYNPPIEDDKIYYVVVNENRAEYEQMTDAEIDLTVSGSKLAFKLSPAIAAGVGVAALATGSFLVAGVAAGILAFLLTEPGKQCIALCCKMSENLEEIEKEKNGEQPVNEAAQEKKNELNDMIDEVEAEKWMDAGADAIKKGTEVYKGAGKIL